MESRSSVKDPSANPRPGAAAATQPGTGARRSSPRLPLAIPIVLKGTDTSGRTFIEHTHTILINQAGLKTISRQSLEVGARLQIAVPSRQRVSWASVAWVGNRKGEGQEVGIALEQTDDFWGVQFPSGPTEPKTAPAASPHPASPVAEPSSSATGQESGQRTRSSSREGESGTSDKLSGVLRELAETALRDCLEEALRTLRERASEIQSASSGDFVMQLQASMEQALSAAAERLELLAAEIASRHQQVWEQNLTMQCRAAEERLQARWKEQEQAIAASMARMRQELAERMTAASRSLHGE